MFKLKHQLYIPNRFYSWSINLMHYWHLLLMKLIDLCLSAVGEDNKAIGSLKVAIPKDLESIFGAA
jgi:hypothetical protein